MNIGHLPPPIQSLITEFCFRATLTETKKSLAYIRSIAIRQLHPLVVRTYAGEYADCLDTLWYDKKLKLSSIFGAYAPGRRTELSPLVEFFVWFSKDELYHYDRIHRLLFDLDWRRIRPMAQIVGHASREAFADWVCSTPDGLEYMSHLISLLDPNMFKKSPIFSVLFETGSANVPTALFI